jgi:hypothetical protein
MRKSRFLLSLIAATAIGLSAVGCDSSSSGGVADTSDLTVPNNNNNVNERLSLREYMLVAQRGLETNFAPNFSAGQSAPADPGGLVVAAPGDGDIGSNPPQLWEISGIADTPVPNANLTTPGNSTNSTPNTPDAGLLPDGASGFHQIYASPTGTFAIGLGRAKDRGFAGDSVDRARMQIFGMDFEAPLDVVFPPNVVFNAVADPVSILNYSPGQGEFASGAWSPNAQQFYASIDNGIDVFSVDGTIGRLDPVQSVIFPFGGAGVNNAVKLIASPNGGFLYALDNANAQLVTYARNAVDGTLTEVAISPIVSDPRGATLDRSGRFMYIVGRTSGQLAGYEVLADGSLAPIDLFPELGIGPIPFTFGQPLGDVAANSQLDQLFLTTYLGVMQGYSVNTTTGALTAVGSGASPLGGARNAANIEVEPTGRFVVAAYEHDFDTFQPFVTPANGWPYFEDAVFTNIDSASNGVAPLSATPNFDALGRIVYTLPNPAPFTGEVQVFRVQANGTPRSEQAQASANPYGLSFFQRVVQAPSGAGAEPIQP